MLDTKMIDNLVHAKCERCKQFKKAHSQAGHSIEGGIRVDFIGGYADYYDPIGADELVRIDICHECTVEVLKFIGVYNNSKFHAGHSSKDQACCDNCWIPYYENDKWVGTKDLQGNIILFNDKVL